MSKIVRMARKFGVKPDFTPPKIDRLATELSIRAIKKHKAVRDDDNRKQTLKWLRSMRGGPNKNVTLVARYTNKKTHVISLTRRNGEDPRHIAQEIANVITNLRRICINERQNINRKRKAARSPVFLQNQYGLVKSGGVYQNAGSIFQFINRTKLEQISKSKEPKIIGERHYGIELEFICAVEERQLRVDLLPVADYIHLGGDGSIQAPRGYRGYEIRLCVPAQNLHSVVSETCRILKKSKAFVNKTCGMHVHMDMRAKLLQLESRSTKQIVENFHHSQAVLFSMQPESRRNNRYCKRITNFNDQVPDRYHGINTSALGKYSTIEIRMHSATVNAGKILHWCDLLTKIIEHKGIAKNLKLPQYQKQLGVTGALKEYMDQRIERFGELTAEDEEAVDVGPAPVRGPSRQAMSDEFFSQRMAWDPDDFRDRIVNMYRYVEKHKKRVEEVPQPAVQYRKEIPDNYIQPEYTVSGVRYRIKSGSGETFYFLSAGRANDGINDTSWCVRNSTDYLVSNDNELIAWSINNNDFVNINTGLRYSSHAEAVTQLRIIGSSYLGETLDQLAINQRVSSALDRWGARERTLQAQTLSTPVFNTLPNPNAASRFLDRIALDYGVTWPNAELSP